MNMDMGRNSEIAETQQLISDALKLTDAEKISMNIYIVIVI